MVCVDVDEPTSGLDSTASRLVMAAMQRVSANEQPNGRSATPATGRHMNLHAQRSVVAHCILLDVQSLVVCVVLPYGCTAWHWHLVTVWLENESTCNSTGIPVLCTDVCSTGWLVTNE
jgi:hypothetical protein